MTGAVGMGAWTPAVLDYLSGSATSRFRDQEVTVADHWQGRDNLLWRVQSSGGTDAVVKMFTDAGQARSRRQFDGQAQFAAAGLAPEPLWYDRYPNGLPRQILVYRWEDGEALTIADRFQRMAHADAAAQVHCADRDDVQRFSPHPFNLLTFWQIWQAGEGPLRDWVSAAPAPLLAEQLSMLWSAVHRMMDATLPLLGETSPTPVHGDLSAENALFHKGRVLLVDWEFFGLGDAAQEIARFLFYGGEAWSDEGREEWMECYQAGNSDPSLPVRVDMYLRLFNFQALTFLLEGIRQGNVPQLADTDSEAEGVQFLSFLTSALTTALRRSLTRWELSPLGEGDYRELEVEISFLANTEVPER